MHYPLIISTFIFAIGMIILAIGIGKKSEDAKFLGASILALDLILGFGFACSVLTVDEQNTILNPKSVLVNNNCIIAIINDKNETMVKTTKAEIINEYKSGGAVLVKETKYFNSYGGQSSLPTVEIFIGGWKI